MFVNPWFAIHALSVPEPEGNQLGFKRKYKLTENGLLLVMQARLVLDPKLFDSSTVLSGT